MKKSVAMKWVKALRSGRYKQTDGQLMYRGLDGKPSYCCLGVLCRVVGKPAKAGPDGEEVAPPKVCALAGLAEGDPKTSITREYEGKTYHKTLSVLNDSGKSFEEIADIIEQEWRNF
jgi:hypothetical protein